MKRLMLAVVAACAASMTACGGGEVAVQAFVAGEDGQPRPIRNLPVRALPYDRDALFDSLRAAYATEEPPIPPDLAVLQDSIAVANQQWTIANARWATGRDSLRVLGEQLQAMQRMNPQYLPLFNRWNALDAQVRTAEQASNQAFQRFTNLSNRYTARAEEVRQSREQWADAAYADIDRIIATRQRETGLQERADTTDGNGTARLTGLRTGQWWIHARYDLLFTELYWNIPVQIDGETVQVQLTRETAQERPKL